jgi:hypothetical protein
MDATASTQAWVYTEERHDGVAAQTSVTHGSQAAGRDPIVVAHLLHATAVRVTGSDVMPVTGSVAVMSAVQRQPR